MTDTVNVADALNAFATSLTESRATLVAQLELLDQQRVDVVKQLGQIDRINAALSGKPMTSEKSDGSTGRKWKMSDEGRARISAALRARSERLAAEKAAAVGANVSEAVAVPSSAPKMESETAQEAPASAEATAPKKSAKKAVADAAKI